MSLKTNILIDEFDEITDPVDFLEAASEVNDWTYSRPSKNRISVNIKGQCDTYKMDFIWNEDNQCVSLQCDIGLYFDEESQDYLPKTLMDMNARMWIGSFAYMPEEKLIFRHAIRLNGLGNLGFDQLSEITAIARDECDRFYLFFSMIAQKQCQDQEKLYLALADIEGQA